MKLLNLHGFTQNGDVLREHLGPLFGALPAQVTCVYPHGPHACSAESLARLRAMIGGEQPPPHLSWWNATDDGRVYRGLEQTLASLAAEIGVDEAFGVLGFSQGALLAAALAGLAERGEFARPAFVVLVAGRIPRADVLRPLFERPLAVPSLHIWGERDPMALAEAPKLADKFDPTLRELMPWDGPHVLPTFGPAADSILTFIRNKACI